MRVCVSEKFVAEVQLLAHVRHHAGAQPELSGSAASIVGTFSATARAQAERAEELIIEAEKHESCWYREDVVVSDMAAEGCCVGKKKSSTTQVPWPCRRDGFRSWFMRRGGRKLGGLC